MCAASENVQDEKSELPFQLGQNKISLYCTIREIIITRTRSRNFQKKLVVWGNMSYNECWRDIKVGFMKKQIVALMWTIFMWCERTLTCTATSVFESWLVCKEIYIISSNALQIILT